MGDHLTPQFARARGPCLLLRDTGHNTRRPTGSCVEELGCGEREGRASHTGGIRASPATKAEGTAACPLRWSPSLLSPPGAAPRRPLSGAGGPEAASTTVLPLGAAAAWTGPAAWRRALAVGEARGWVWGHIPASVRIPVSTPLPRGWGAGGLWVPHRQGFRSGEGLAALRVAEKSRCVSKINNHFKSSFSSNQETAETAWEVLVLPGALTGAPGLSGFRAHSCCGMPCSL